MTPEAALVVVRLAHFGAALLLLGTIVFRRWTAAPDVSRALADRLRRWEVWASLAVLGSALLWLMLEAAVAGDGWASATDPATMSVLLSGTWFGQAMGVRTVLAALTLAAAWSRWTLGVELGAWLLCLTLGIVGHGVMLSGGFGWLLSAALGLHVAAAGVWAGALPALFVCLAESGRSYPLASTVSTTEAFSRLSRWAVLVVVATGSIATVVILGGHGPDFTSSYQQLLAAKVALVAAMIGIAWVNGFVLLPRLVRGSGSAVRHLGATIIVETILAAGVLGLVALLGNLSPAG